MGKVAIICSTQDIAGMNIRNRLIEEHDFEFLDEEFEAGPVYNKDAVRIYTTLNDSVMCEGLDKEIDADLFIFATRHQAKSGKPTLSVHCQGNWGEAGFGGQKGKLGLAYASIMKRALTMMRDYADGWEVCQEVTHHGPYMDKPSMFIEIGSSEEHWRDEDAASLIARVIVQLLGELDEPYYPTAIGLGGTHYAANFMKIIFDSDYAFSHICAKYQLQNLDENMLQQAIDRTLEDVECVILDWKGMGKEKQRIVQLCKDMGLQVKRTNEF